MMRAAAPPCPACPPAARYCGCLAAEAAADKAAQRWFSTAAPDEKLPTMDSNRFLGGNLDRHDRTPPIDAVHAFEAARRDRLVCALYLEQLDDRLQVIQGRARLDKAEAKELRRDRHILRRYLSGGNLDALARQLGRSSHAWTSHQLRRIKAAAYDRNGRQRPVAAACRCGRPGCTITTFAATGRPRKYSSRKCRDYVWRRMRGVEKR